MTIFFRFVLISVAVCGSTLPSCTRSEDAAAPIKHAPAVEQKAAEITGNSGLAGESSGTRHAAGGNAKFGTITSKSPCRADADCTFTKFANVPQKTSECTCQASCEPYVVNNKEAARRKEANDRLCKVDDWFGPKCPAPACNFIEYDKFECREGLCIGIDLDGI